MTIASDNFKGMGRRWSWSVLRYYIVIRSEGLR